MEVVFFVYGFSFLALGLIVVVSIRKQAQPELSSALSWLAAFAVVHGSLEWMELWRLMRGDTPLFAALRPMVLLGSYLLLFEFGRRLVRAFQGMNGGGPVAGRLTDARIYLLLVAGVIFGSVFAKDVSLQLTILSRYLVGAPACALAGIGVLRYWRKSDRKAAGTVEARRLSRSYRTAGTAFLLYGIFGGLVVPQADWPPASWLNQDWFLATFHVPVQLLRALCAVLIAAALGYVLFWHASLKGKIWLLTSAVVALIMGADLVAGYFGIEHSIEEELNRDAKNLRAVLMAMRRVYHQQFIASGLPVNEQTVGFLPAHALSRISKDFPNWSQTGLIFNNVSDRPRNPANQADGFELEAMAYFRANPKAEERLVEIRQNGESYYHYTAPIWMEQYCLKCHGEREKAPPSIARAYDAAYGYEVGELRGVMSIKLPASFQREHAFHDWFIQFALRYLGYTLLAVLLLLFLNRVVIARLVRLGQTAGQFATGNYAARCTTIGGDEVSDLSEAFNRMGDEVQKRDAQISSLSDDRLKALKDMDHIAHYDILTDLPNRRLLDDRMGQAIARARRSGRPLAVCYLDLDGFKPINDRYGHKTGDVLLIEVANRLKGLLRGDDTVARLGGDEFVLLLNDLAHPDECYLILERILEAVKRPVLIGELSLTVSASIGVSLYPGDQGDPDTLLRHADQAMYAAKQAGKNRYDLFDPVQDQRTQSHREKFLRLGEALRDDEFLLHYQPKVDLVSGEVIGVEALIRWQHPDEGLLFPGAFLNYLEHSTLEIAVGEWVIESALRQMEAWRAAGLRPDVSVNIAANQLLQPDFAERLRLTLARHPEVEAGRLELEILETAALSDIEQATQALAACRKLGVRIALDDFGTGYSSLTYFRRLPVDILKIDQSFVRDMLEDPNDLDIVESVVQLAQTFGRPVIAEGVETLEHGTVLVAIGCRLCQGYGIARPMPAERLPGWMEQWRREAVWTRLAPTVRNREDLPLAVAAQSHRNWVDDLVAQLGRGETQIVVEPDARHCRFGRWYRGSGAVRYGALVEFQAIAPLHERIHGLGTELAELAAEGQGDAARARLPELFAVRDELLALLDALMAKIADAGPEYGSQGAGSLSTSQ